MTTNRGFYAYYRECRADAQARANEMGRSQALRVVREYGTRGYVFASGSARTEPRAEIVEPMLRAEAR